jgi:hypothetical protein
VLNRIGKGPGEYSSVFCVLDNQDQSEIILFDLQKHKLNFYNLTGEFLRQTDLKFAGNNVMLLSSSQVAIHSGRMGRNKENCESAICDLNGNIEKTRFPFKIPIWSDCCFGFTVGTKPNSVLYHKIFDYRIYEVFANRVDTLITLYFGTAAIDTAKYFTNETIDQAQEETGKILGFNSIANTAEHLAFNISSEKRIRGTWVLDHRSKNHQFLAVVRNTIGTFKGIPVPAPRQADGSWFVSSILGLNWNEAIGTLTEAQKVILRKEVPGFIESEKVTMDGNPVLVCYRFKDF